MTTTDAAPIRNGYSTLDALDVTTGRSRYVFVSHRLRDSFRDRGMGKAKEAAYLMPQALTTPRAVFQGIREHPEGEDDGLCHVLVPTSAYTRTGVEVPAPGGNVFLVFVSPAAVVYKWYWSACDNAVPYLPEHHDTRFRIRIL